MRSLVAALLLVGIGSSCVVAQTTEPGAASAGAATSQPAVAYGKPVTTGIKKGEMMTYRSEGHDIQAYMVEPAVDGPHPAVIVVPDIFGMTDWVRGKADELAKQGYTVLVPNLYSRIPETEHGVNAQQAYLDYEQTGDQQVMADLSGAVEFLQMDGKATAGQPLGIVGFDMGGIYSMMMAGMDLRVTAAVNYYGRVLYSSTSQARPMSPVEDLLNLHAPLLSFYGTNDPQVPEDQVRELETRLSHNPNGVFYEVVRYPGVGHGFLVSTRQGYNAQAAEQSCGKVREFLARWLRAEPKKSEE